jgi:hypothetical protein
MNSTEANIIALNAIVTQNNFPDIFNAIEQRAKEGRGDVKYPYNEAISSILSQLGYHCYKTSGDFMMITWNAAIENYWFEMFNSKK